MAAPHRIYVTNPGTDTVSVFDSAKGLVATVPVMSKPYGIAVTPTKSFVYVTNYASGTVSVIDALTNKVVKTILDLPLPTRVAAAKTPKGDLAYVAVEVPGKNGYVAVVNTATHRVVKEIPVGMQPDGVAFTPDAKWALVTNFLSSNISVIDTTKLAVVKTLGNQGVTHQPFGVAVTPDGKKAYVPLQAQNGMFKWVAAVIDMTTMQLVPWNKYVTFFTRVFGVATEPKRRYAWFTEEAFNRADYVDEKKDAMTGGVVIQSLQKGLVGPRELAITRDGALCYVTCTWGDFVAVIDLRAGALLPRLALPKGSEPFGLALLES